MAPQPGHTVDHTPEYEEFISTLRDYHSKRGTNFEPEPKVGQTPVDLLKLFKAVIEHGGYDKISEEKLAWRNMANLLELYSSNEASAAYSLKLAYYKNLAAYEITTIHHQEPPPPEILEHISAKGGNLLTRTLENFSGNHRAMRPSSGVFDSPAAASVVDDNMTPGRAPAVDGTPLSGRASRGLREAPPQRVIFQPDTSSTRQSRHASAAGTPSGHHVASHHLPPGTPQGHLTHTPFAMHVLPPGAGGPSPSPHHPKQPTHATPQPHHRSASALFNPPNTELFSSTVQVYEPRGPVPIMLQTVEAPAVAPGKFLQRQRLQRLQVSGVNLSRAARPPVPMGCEGPNIYVRCLGALRSGVPAEEAFALSHLVKISFERGDKYKFESFPGLAEGLVEKALQVGALFYHDVQWKLSYDLEMDETDMGELDGVNGTPDILARIAQLRPRDTIDCIQTEAFTDQLVLVTEAALTIRNMVTLPDNAYFIADFPPCRDLLCIVLNLPALDAVVELKHCALDIAEQLTPYLTLSDDDPLYQTLLRQLRSDDRGTVLTALRAVGRIAMTKEQTNRLGSVPPSVLQSVMNWLLLNDDELLDACLDFLYQYTAVAANVERLLQSVRTEGLVSHLVRLLSHGAKRSYKELVLQPEHKRPASETVLTLPPDLLPRLVETDEPERCYTWLRCFFEEDPDSSITQIAIWQAYQSSFLQPVQQAGRTMLGAAEFIRNVTHVYHAAGAQIQKERGPQGDEVQKFIIKGIRPRVRPMSPDGREFFQCQWQVPSVQPQQPQQAAQKQPASHQCGIFFGSAEKMYAHILTAHLGETVGADGKVTNKTRPLRCLWAGCHAYPETAPMPLVDFMRHVKTHTVRAEQDNRQTQPAQPVADAASTNAAAAKEASGSAGAGALTTNPLKHQRQRSSVTNGDLMAVSGGPNGSANGGANGISSGGTASNSGGGSGGSLSKRQKRTYIVPAKTMGVAYEETATMRDERGPSNSQLPALPQAAGIPLSAALVLRNIARNAAKADVVLDERSQVVLAVRDEAAQRERQQQKQRPGADVGAGAKRGSRASSSLLAPSAASKSGPGSGVGGRHSPAELAAAAAAQEGGGWNERLFRPMLPRLYEIMAENRALASYVVSLLELIGEGP